MTIAPPPALSRGDRGRGSMNYVGRHGAIAAILWATVALVTWLVLPAGH